MDDENNCLMDVQWACSKFEESDNIAQMNCDLVRVKTNMTMEIPPFEDVFPIEHGDFPMSC